MRLPITNGTKGMRRSTPAAPVSAVLRRWIERRRFAAVVDVAVGWSGLVASSAEPLRRSAEEERVAAYLPQLEVRPLFLALCRVLSSFTNFY